jgi:hypothetical protein
VQRNGKENFFIMSGRQGQAKRPRRALLADPFMWSSIWPEHTGLPLYVWIAGFWPWTRMSAPRVKVARSRKTRWADLVLVAIHPAVRVVGRRGTLRASELALLRTWVELNRDVLMRHWEGDLGSSKDALNALRPIQLT